MALPRTYGDVRSRVLDRGFWAGIRMRLASRSRLTNLGVLLLAGALVLSLLGNMQTPAAPRVEPPALLCEQSAPDYNVNARLSMPELPGGTTEETLKHLIIVPGHAVWSASARSAWLTKQRAATCRKSRMRTIGSSSRTSAKGACRRSSST